MKASFFWQWVVAVFLVIIATAVQASGVKFSIIPILRAPGVMPANGVALTQYLVTNNTGIVRELTTIPIAGVHHLVTGAPGGCNVPFVLGPGQSCLMTLQLVGSEMWGGGVHSGPEVCKTMGPFDNRPDPFLCSQPYPTDFIQVRLSPATPVTLTAVPTSIAFEIGHVGKLTVTNTSPIGFAQHIDAHFLANSGISVIGSTCPIHLAPSTSCVILFGSQLPAVTTMSIMGSNTNQLLIPITATPIPISISPSPLVFGVGNIGTVTVKNLSAVTFAQNINAQIPLGSGISQVSSTCQAPLAPGATCTISFTATSAQTGIIIPIQGSNTTSANLVVTSQLVPIRLNPSSLRIYVNGGTGSVILTNLSPLFTATGITATIPAGINLAQTNNCGTVPPLGSCTIDFTAGSTLYPDGVNVQVQGSNTTAGVVKVYVLQAAISVSPPTLEMTEENTAAVTVTNTSLFGFPALGVTAPPDVAGITVQNNACPPSLAPGNSCVITFIAPNIMVFGVSIPISGSNTDTVQVPVTVSEVILSISPTVLHLLIGGSGTITVQNTSGTETAQNIQPDPSTLYNAGLSTAPCNGIPFDLGPGASCTMGFNAAATAPNTENVAIRGDNTNNSILQINTSAEPVLTVNPTIATITADGSTITVFTVSSLAITGAVDATNVQIHLPSTWTNVQQVPSLGCQSLAPGSSNCTIQLSSATPYVGEGNIVVRGDNTSHTSPTVNIGFLFNGGLVFDTSNGVTVARLVDNSTNAEWMVIPTETTAKSLTDGLGNTHTMLNESVLFLAPAASTCVSLGAGWFLPALNQLAEMRNQSALGFGNFSTANYWSSTQVDNGQKLAYWVHFPRPPPLDGWDAETVQNFVRCAITY